MSSITASTDMSNVKPEELAKFVDLFFQAVADTVNGKLDFQTNLNCKLINITFTAANTDASAGHGLGRVPSGYIITSSSVATSVYSGSAASTASNIILRANVPATVGLLVY